MNRRWRKRAAMEDELKKEQTTDSGKKSRLPFILFAASLLIMTAAAWIYFNEDTADLSYKGDVWYDDYTPDAVELVLSEENASHEVYDTLEVAYSASAEFSGTGSIIAEDEKNYYLADPTKEGFIYSIARSDRSRELIMQIPASELVLFQGRLYFINPSDVEKYKAGLYSCYTDGSGLKFMIEGDLRSLKEDKGILYYVRNYDKRLCCLDPAAGPEKALSEEECLSYAVSDNAIFYVTKDDNRENGADKVICRMAKEGGSGYHLTEYGNYGDIGFIGGMLGFVVYDQGYGLIDPESDITLSLSELEKKLTDMEGLYSLPVEAEGYLWYIDRSRDRQLVRMDLETKKEEQLEAYKVTAFYITSDSILYGFMEDGVRYALASRLTEGFGMAALLEGELR